MRIGTTLLVSLALAASGCSSTTANSGEGNATADASSADIGLSFDSSKDVGATEPVDIGVAKDAAPGTDAEGAQDVELTDAQAPEDVHVADVIADVPQVPDVPPVKDVPPAPDVQVTPDVPVTPDVGPPDSGPATTETGCPSGLKWLTGALFGSDLMEPGLACIECHKTKGPMFTIAGTVDPGFHTDDACGGVNGIKVEITGADGKVLTLSTNLAGNFKSSDAVAMPFTARVIDGNGKDRKMFTPQSDGDCNICHTLNGTNGAPGRIRAP